MTGQLKVATVVTRLTAGAGGVALRGALSLDPSRYSVTMFSGGGDLSQRQRQRQWQRQTGSGCAVLKGRAALENAPVGDLMATAYNAGLSVVRVPSLMPTIAPVLDAITVRILTSQFSEGGFDVVHTHSSKAGAIGRVAAERASVRRVVHTYHGFPFHEFQSAVRRKTYIGIERWLAGRTDVILAVGSGVATEAIRRRVAEPERIRTISPVIDTIVCADPAAARTAARLQLGLPAEARLIGTVGRIDYQKAPEHWADAFADVATSPDGQDVWGVWIGDGPMRGRLRSRIRNRGVESRFRLLGFRADVSDLLPALDVFALASRYEGLPCALVEAVSAGVPVVATAVNAVPDLVIPGETGLLVPADEPRMLGRAISYLLGNRTEAIRMAANAKTRVGDWYSPDVLGLVLDQTYRGRETWN